MSQIRKLLPRHAQIVDLLLTGNYNCREIAEITGVSYKTIFNIKNSPQVQHDLAMRKDRKDQMTDAVQVLDAIDVREKAARKIRAEAENAAMTLIELLSDNDSKTRRAAANDVLDRAGIPRVTKNQNESCSTVVVLDAEMAKTIKESLELDKD